MTDKQIIELIKIARQNGLASGGTFGHHAGWCDEIADCLEELLDTIQRQKDEIERLTSENEDLLGNCGELGARIMMLKAQLATARGDAVREFCAEWRH